MWRGCLFSQKKVCNTKKLKKGGIPFLVLSLTLLNKIVLTPVTNPLVATYIYAFT